MSRIPNADTFLLEFRKACDAYGQVFAPQLAEVRRIYGPAGAGGVLSPADKETLEAHVRVYVVNSLLAALNWRLDSRPEDGLGRLTPEAPIRSDERGTTRFLDYLGLENATEIPLLIVETKRPSASLPQARRRVRSYQEAVSIGLAAGSLSADWTKWLTDLTDYVCSTHSRTGHAPRRVVLTNGNWLIVFLDPCDAFLEDGTRDPGRIVVFEDRNDIEGRAGELFEYLEHQHVLGETQPLTVGELLFHLTAEMIECAMHGLLLRYVEQLGVYRTAPIVKVAPVVLLRSRYGAWLQIESSPKDYELPHEESELNRHLAEVQQAATQLLAEVNSQLKSVVQVIPLLKHYGDDEFSAFPGVRDRGRDKFLLTTGSRTHYLSPTPSIPDCPYHDWAVCNRAGVPSNPGPISIRSTLPRSFFMSLERHHCAHRDVSTAKATPISAANQASCGPRSGRFGQAFCEIWRFEQHLCCRSCVFEEVCLKAPAFQLLCARNVEAAASTETAASGC